MVLGGRSLGDPAEVLTVQEVAEYLKVTTKTVYTLVKGGSLPSFRVGRVLRCRRIDVEAFIAQQMGESMNGSGVRHDLPETRRGGAA